MHHSLGEIFPNQQTVLHDQLHIVDNVWISLPLKSSWFLFGYDCDPSPRSGTLAMFGVTIGEEGYGRPLVCEDQGYFYTSCNTQVNLSTMRNYPAPSGNSTEIEKPCSKQIGNFTFIYVSLSLMSRLEFWIWNAQNLTHHITKKRHQGGHLAVDFAGSYRELIIN